MASQAATLKRPSRGKPGIRRKLIWAAVAIGIGALYWHAWNDIGGSFGALFSSWGNLGDLLRRSTPPNTAIFHEAVDA